VDTRTIHWLINVRGGYSLLDRNKDGFTPRELAYKRGRDNTVKMIDRVCAYVVSFLHTIKIHSKLTFMLPLEMCICKMNNYFKINIV